MKTIKDLAKALCQTEGLKKQVNIAQMSEILGVLSDIMYINPLVYSVVVANGHRRHEKEMHAISNQLNAFKAHVNSHVRFVEILKRKAKKGEKK